jgi:crotonobetainyl-CoA:carnitine CoA-transferase CaiB-like acyl-CoA transferase
MSQPQMALDGIRVIDLTEVMAGPFATMLLADLGADVVKVEPPRRGDRSRRMDPITTGGESGAFLAVNRNKRSIVLNLKAPRGLELLRSLVAEADVLVENYRPGVTARLGIDYPALATVNPRLVYASISGFGQTGPKAHRGGFDLIAQGESGIMSVTGDPAGGSPVKSGIPVTDLGAGLFLIYGILSALLARARTGEGQHVDTSLFEAGLGLSVWEATEHFYTGRTPRPTGSAHRLSAPYQAFETADGHITVGADGELHWPRFCALIGRPELADDPRFQTNAKRLEHLAELVPLIEERTRCASRQERLERLHQAGIPAGSINSVPEALHDPQTVAREMVLELDHPRAGRIRALGPPVKLSGTPATVRRPAPDFGEHTVEVLGDLGLDAEAVAALRADGIVE